MWRYLLLIAVLIALIVCVVAMVGCGGGGLNLGGSQGAGTVPLNPGSSIPNPTNSVGSGGPPTSPF
jgi:hypothetical protein